MKTIVLFAGSVILLLNTLVGGNVPRNIAEKVAINVFAEKFARYHKYQLAEPVRILTCHEEKAGADMLYYVFQMSPEGFVIISGQDALPPVLAFSPGGSFDVNFKGANVYWWMSCYRDQARHAVNNNLHASEKIAGSWHYWLGASEKILNSVDSWGQLDPLMTSRWNQNFPYNYYAPPDPAGPGGHALAGCMATAGAQILYYYRWPEYGQGRKSYLPVSHPEYGLQSADFGNTRYRYEEMKDTDGGVNRAIAEYIYQSGVWLEMDFDPYASVGLNVDSGDFYFRILPYEFYERSDYTDSAWIFMLKKELDARKPIYYTGNSTNSGHAFVCDGYLDSALFHFNFGWSGQNDGYYSIDNVQGFNFDQTIVSTVFPDTIHYEYPVYETGNHALTALQGSLTDGSGPLHNYLNNMNVTWLINPQTGTDSVQKIELGFARFQTFDAGDKLIIYDGGDQNAPVLAELYGDAMPPAITSTGNRLFIKFETNGSDTGEGFLLNYQAKLPELCKGTTIVEDSACTITDGSGRFNYQNLKSCKWRIEPAGCDSSLTLRFLSFDTEPELDYLSVYDMNSGLLIQKYSGHFAEPPDPVIVESGKAMLVFNTNGSVTGQGWEVCYGKMTGMGSYPGIRNLKVLPNPATDQIIVEFTVEKASRVRISLMDVVGHEIKYLERYPEGNRNLVERLPLTDLTPGLYFLRLECQGKDITRKVIKL